MPALQAAALQPFDWDPIPELAAAWAAVGGSADLALSIPHSEAWSVLEPEIPFEACNDLLGRQMDTYAGWTLHIPLWAIEYACSDEEA